MTRKTLSVEVPLEWAADVAALAAYVSAVAERGCEGRDLLHEEVRLQDHLHAIGREAMRTILESADSVASEVDCAGDRWGNRKVSPADVVTLFGTTTIMRAAYQRGGRGQVLIPVASRLGLIEGRYTPKVARAVARAQAMGPANEAEALFSELGVAKVSMSTFNRLPQAIMARHEERKPEIDTAMREQNMVPSRAVSVQVSLDGVMVPQDGEHARARGRKPSDGESEPPRHATHYDLPDLIVPANSNGQSGRAWHEASVSTLHFADELGRPLGTIYGARMPEPRKATLLADLEAELVLTLEQQPELHIVFASDGAPYHWTALEELAQHIAPLHQGRVFFVLDFFHAAEYLSKAAELIWPDDSNRHVFAATWRERLQKTPSGPQAVIGALRHQRGLLKHAATRDKLQTIIDYLAAHANAGRMAYADLEAAMLPIGSGVVEAAAKTLVSVRMKRAGARFSQHGGQTILTIRAAIASQRYDTLMGALQSSYTKEIHDVRPLRVA